MGTMWLGIITSTLTGTTPIISLNNYLNETVIKIKQAIKLLFNYIAFDPFNIQNKQQKKYWNKIIYKKPPVFQLNST